MRRRVLIVDDDPDAVVLLGRMLAQTGLEPCAAASFAAAEHILGAATFDAILLDQRLEPGFGVDLVPLARARNPLARILVHSAVADCTVAARAMRLGATDYAEKSSDADAYRAFVAGTALFSERPRSEPASLEAQRVRQVWAVFQDERGNVRAAARRLGLYRTSLQRLLRSTRPPAELLGAELDRDE